VIYRVWHVKLVTNSMQGCGDGHATLTTLVNLWSGILYSSCRVTFLLVGNGLLFSVHSSLHSYCLASVVYHC